jgi:hypothetical protein
MPNGKPWSSGLRSAGTRAWFGRGACSNGFSRAANSGDVSKPITSSGAGSRASERKLPTAGVDPESGGWACSACKKRVRVRRGSEWPGESCEQIVDVKEADGPYVIRTCSQCGRPI